MRTKFLSYLFIIGLSHLASAGTGDETSLLFEFKKQVTCVAAKSELSGYKIEVECDRSDAKKMRYFGGRYLGKKPVNAIVAELKKNSQIAGITQNRPAHRTQ
jgi:hypothetical protein